MSVALVTGGSSGIGQAAAQALHHAGYTVYEISRRDHEQPGVTHLTADVTDEASVQAAVATVMQREGRIDLVINNAGFGISGGVEFTETADAERLFNVDFFGMVRTNRAVLPVMRQQGSGRIINVSSIAAITPIPFQTYYSAAKAAVSAYTMALQNEVRPFGISVCALLPGDVATGFTAAREKSPAGDAEYNHRISRSVARMERDEQTGMPPARVGKRLAAIARKRHVKPFYSLGFFYQLVTVLVKILPARTANWVLYKMYAR